MRGIERRIEAGLDPDVRLGRLGVHQPLGCRRLRRGSGGAAKHARPRGRQANLRAPIASCSSPRPGCELANEGARPQRLLWASTGTKDPEAPTSSTSRASPRRRRSTRCPRRRCWPSPSTARSASRSQPTAATPRNPRGLRRRRHRHRRGRREAADGRRRVVRRLLARAARDDRRAAQSSRLTGVAQTHAQR